MEMRGRWVTRRIRRQGARAEFDTRERERREPAPRAPASIRGAASDMQYRIVHVSVRLHFAFPR
eukprot:COSAG02_NODE_1785_length_10940_cov_9.153399_10_plen_64_part_00